MPTVATAVSTLISQLCNRLKRLRPELFKPDESGNPSRTASFCHVNVQRLDSFHPAAGARGGSDDSDEEDGINGDATCYTSLPRPNWATFTSASWHLPMEVLGL